MSKVIDITGQRFGKLTVLAFDKQDKFRQYMWFCKCDCGNIVSVRGYSLRSGNTQSCGCVQKEVNIKLRQTHGMADTRIYNIWQGMKQRCSLPSLSCYKYYGGRGITFCDEWQKFEPFYEWAMANGYADNLTLDRIDVNGNYEPQNCRWITLKEQQRNRRTTHFITFNGETKTLKEWAEQLGINHTTLLERLNYPNWSVEEALTIPKGGKQKWG
jgi:hypothetical protein